MDNSRCFFRRASSSKRSLLNSFKYAFSILSLSNSSSSSLICSTLVSTVFSSLDLETFLLNVEQEENVDFQAGIEIEKYTGFSSSMYDSTVNGSTYELTMRTKVGDKTVKFTIEIVKNENGYGIYNLDLDT